MARIVLLSIIVIWPFAMTALLYFKRSKLTEPSLKRKLNSLFDGIKINKFSALMYTSIFCIRRLLIVCILLVLKEKGVWIVYGYHVL